MTGFDTPQHRTGDRSRLTAAGESTAPGPSPRVKGLPEQECGVIVHDCQRAHRRFRLRGHVLSVRIGRKAETGENPHRLDRPPPRPRLAGTAACITQASSNGSAGREEGNDDGPPVDRA